MLKKRIIPCLDIDQGRTVKGVSFKNLRDAGDPLELAQRYVDEGADELVFLDISATHEKRKTLLPLVEKIAQIINIPFTVGGGIDSVELGKEVIAAGADKLSINSSAVRRPELIKELASEVGSQAVVVAIDTHKEKGQWHVYTRGGRKKTEWLTEKWAYTAEQFGAGELLLTSMNHDGQKKGFAIELLQLIGNAVNLPIIASGGAGEINHFVDVFSKTNSTGALAASIFHFGEVPIPDLKNYLKTQNIAIR